MNTSKVASALNTLSLGIAELAEALSDGTAPVLAPLRGDEEVPEFPPMEQTYEVVPLPAETPGLGKCPNHNTPWTIKSAGVSKAGKPFNSFYKCDGKNPDDTWCDKRPTRGWVDAHPIRAAVPA